MVTSASELILIGILALLWTSILVFKSSLRKELLASSILALLLVPLGFTFQGGPGSLSDLRAVDLAFAPLLGGIAATIFHLILGKHYHLLPSIRPESFVTDLKPQSWLLRMIGLLASYAWIAIMLTFVFAERPALAYIIAAVVVALYIVAHRKDLLVDSIVSGLLTTSIVFLSALVATQIEPLSESGNVVLGVPTDLLLWSLGVGILLGPAYEYIRRLSVTSTQNV